MKVIMSVGRHARKACVMVGWSRRFYFEGPEPPPDSLITLEFGGLRAFNVKDLVAWLSVRLAAVLGPDAETPASRRREIARLPESCWRPTVLDDFIDSMEWQMALWSAGAQFSLSDFHAFQRKWAPVAEARLAEIIATPQGRPRLAAIKRHQEVIQRILNVAGHTSGRMGHEFQAETERLDRLAWAAVIAASSDPRKWVATAAGLKSDSVRQEAAMALARAIERLGQDDADAAWECLKSVGRRGPLRTSTEWNEEFWAIVRPWVRLPEPLAGVTLDLTDAREQRVSTGWDIIRTPRVGPVTPGRTALAICTPGGSVRHWVHGERKLKFRILAAGGSLSRYGCTLTMQGDTRRSLAPALLEIERLDTLANVDPEQAVAAIADLNLPADHLVYRTALAARDDPRQARALGALLIELRFGIDSDVARHLARSEARGNRR